MISHRTVSAVDFALQIVFLQACTALPVCSVDSVKPSQV